jgi:hypothetical protein
MESIRDRPDPIGLAYACAASFIAIAGAHWVFGLLLRRFLV